MKAADACICLSFFANSDYDLPRKHFHAVVHTLNALRLPLAVTQAYLPGKAPIQIPSGIAQREIETESMLFHKERLWNLAAELTDAKKLIFIDADIVFHENNWLEQCVSSLDEFDVIQPFHIAKWLDRDGSLLGMKMCTAAAIEQQKKPSFDTYHCGFGIGMTRTAFDELGGIFDRAISGNGDALFWMAARDDENHKEVLDYYRQRQDPVVDAPSYKAYCERFANKDFAIGCPKNVIATHLWHGDHKDRQYVSRARLFPKSPDNEFDIVESDNDLLEFRTPEIANLQVDPYWNNRWEDGR